MADGDRPPVEAAAVAMLTLRINTPVGEWLSDDDLTVFGAASESALIVMMNMAWLAIAHLARRTGESESNWLQRIAMDLRRLGSTLEAEE